MKKKMMKKVPAKKSPTNTGRRGAGMFSSGIRKTKSGVVAPRPTGPSSPRPPRP